ncbi:PD-(D/E)XK nuclease family protein [Leisingera sp. M658]|uniref:PD-(D/E)XK nuclease family protein n=1 Tax=Leisingera sp. M658 TaxID=2867015 RepID=UPI0021A68169|nr:PD-(D/E)XK nuclease family protein [Leisingera sp. M658]UWQ74400.1 PD-(D/E)XK nuclease family protein [Leisingera sp. M658]
MTTFTAEDLTALFRELAPLRARASKEKPKAPSAPHLERAFAELRGPVENAKARGGLLNPWELAGLNRNEVRVTSALAGLWQEDFGGSVSRSFLALYLYSAIPGIVWLEELQSGYRLRNEVNPLGELADRIDLMIETRNHLIGIEVKIDAGLGPMQLERYAEALEARGRHMGRRASLVLLAPYPLIRDGVSSTTWKDLAAAAREAAGKPERSRSFIEQYIARFGDFVADL